MASAFEFFGITPAFEIDERALEEKYFTLSRDLHPARSARADKQTLLQKQAQTAELNQAYQTLRDPEKRLDALLAHVGFAPKESTSDQKQQIPMDLAEEYFELQETVLDDPELGAEMVSAFSGKITRLALALDQDIFTIASKIHWSSRTNPASTSEEIAKLLDLRKRRSYLLSLIENARKLNRASGGF